MLISLIAAMAKHRVIGKNNQLPWHLPADLKHFKSMTLGKAVIMGRKTYESIGKPLPQRINIILSSDTTYAAPGCQVKQNLEEAMRNLKNIEEVVIMGGAHIYEAYLPWVQRMYITLIDAEFQGDVFFPHFNEEEWKVVSRENHSADDKNNYGYQFLVWERRTD